MKAYFLLFTISLLFLEACSSVQQSKSNVPQVTTTPASLLGQWIGVSPGGESLSMVVTADETLLKVHGDYNNGAIKAEYFGLNANGAHQFNFNRIRFLTPIRNHSPILASGAMFLAPKKDFRNRLTGEFDTIFFEKLNGKRTYQAVMKRAKAAPYTKRIYRRYGSTNGVFKYKDAFSYMSSDNQYLNSLSHSRKLLLKAVAELNAQGWNCLNEVHLNVRQSRRARFLHQEATTSRFLIVSPSGSENLVYNVSSKQNSSATIFDHKRNFPQFKSHFIGRGISVLDFWLLPDKFTGVDSTTYVPVSVYTFGNGWGDKGEGCEFEKTSAFDFALSMGKILFAVLLEYSRSDAAHRGEILSQYASIYGRDLALSSALKDFFKTASDREISYMTRNIGTLMQNGFNLKSIISSNTRESMLQEIESQPGMEKYAARYLDILFDIKKLF